MPRKPRPYNELQKTMDLEILNVSFEEHMERHLQCAPAFLHGTTNGSAGMVEVQRSVMEWKKW